MKKRNFLIVFSILILVIIAISIICINNSDNLELKSIKSKKQLMRIYNSYSSYGSDNIFLQFITLPFSFGNSSLYYSAKNADTVYDSSISEATIDIKANNSTKTESSSKYYKKWIKKIKKSIIRIWNIKYRMLMKLI